MWHAQLDHPQAQILIKLCLPSINKQNDFYEGYVLGKSTKLPFESHKSYTTFLYTLHTDVWGFVYVSSYDGYQFYLIIVDEYS